ncbi:DUF4397 domain-containing protein [Pontibacter rugosus]|uniref:DUF4397 domain-containing protein n=1 Tax=Pontibacter rugosus TaxID=1745966 RepID=A0ABW3SV83_9BACT
MKNPFKKSIVSKAALLFFSVASFSLTGCIDDEVDPVEPTPVAAVSFYHGSPDAPDLDIQLDSKVINSQPFKYTSFSGYTRLSPAAYRIKFTPVNTATAFVDSSYTFKDGKVYSVFAVNRQADMELLIVQDSTNAPASGNAVLRVVNLSPDAPEINISTKGSTAVTVASDLAFKEITPFAALAGNRYSFEVTSADNNEVLLTISNIDIEAGRAYTLVIRGFATPPAGNTNALAAQFIRN